MLTNVACTLYLTQDGKNYKRIYCDRCHWEDTQGTNINKTGSTAVDNVRIFIPLATAEMDDRTGYLVKGNCSFTPTGDQSIRELVTQGAAMTISSIERYDFGSPAMHHWEVYAK